MAEPYAEGAPPQEDSLGCWAELRRLVVEYDKLKARYVQSLERGIESDKKTLEGIVEMKKSADEMAGCFAVLECRHAELRRLAELSLKPDAHQAREALSIWLGENPE